MWIQIVKRIPNPAGFLVSIAVNIIAAILANLLQQLHLPLVLISIAIFIWVYFYWKVAENDTRGWLQFTILFVAFIPLNLLVITALLVSVDVENFVETIAPPEYLKFPSDPTALAVPDKFDAKIQDDGTEILLNYKTVAERRSYCRVNMQLIYDDIRDISLRIANAEESGGLIKVETGGYIFRPRNVADQNSIRPTGYFGLRNGKIPLILPANLPQGTVFTFIMFTLEDVKKVTNLRIKIASERPRLFGDARRFFLIQAFLAVFTLSLVTIAFLQKQEPKPAPRVETQLRDGNQPPNGTQSKEVSGHASEQSKVGNWNDN